MRTFGKAGTVRTGKDGKVGDRGVTMMFVGYADNHEGNCYRMFNPLRNSIVESRDVTWLRRMYYPRPDTDLTGQNPLVVIEADFPREEIVQPEEPRVKIEEIKDDASVSSEVSKASSSLEQVVRRSGRTVTQTTTYNPTTGKAAEISAMQNYYACLAELDNEEFATAIEVHNLHVEVESVGAGLGGGFTNTNELKVMKYREAVNGPDGESWKEEILNEHDRMLKNNVFKAVDRGNIPRGTKVIDST